MAKQNRQQDRASEINQDLLKERSNCPFNLEELTNVLDGGPDKTAERRDLEDFFLSSKDMVDDDIVLETLSCTERYEHDVKRGVQLFKRAKERLGDDGDIASIRVMLGAGIGSIASPDGNPFGLHFVMFLPTILGQGTLEQQGQWLGRAWDMEIIGTYAQTELGHGTFIRGLETTATYDSTTQEFVLNSPTITAFKWWPGGLGKTANYACVMAQLVIQGKRLGPHAFIVQLRDEETHQPLPGIKVGEIGPKLGMSSNDNGFLGFDHHRIPRDHMLMKNAQVEPDGTYVKPPQDKLSYGTMVMVRCAIVQDASAHLRKAVTIAVRYSAVRHQSELRPGEPEPQIMDYTTQQFKLFPALAMSVAFTLVGQKLMNRYEENLQEVEAGNFDQLPEVHALSCGLKALVTQECADSTDILRRACGGHGFMASSNLPRIWGLLTASCTYEGENTVMQLQVARYLIKLVSQPGQSHLPQSLAFMTETSPTAFDWSHESFASLFGLVAKGQLESVARHLADLEQSGMDKALAWNSCSIQLCQAAMAYIRSFVVMEFAKSIQTTSMSNGVKMVMDRLFQLFAIQWILRFSGDFVLHSGMQPRDLNELHKRMLTILSDLRPIAVSVVDAFDFPDASLKSSIGSYDGQVYQRLYEAALKSPLNKTDVPDAYWKHVKPLMTSNL